MFRAALVTAIVVFISFVALFAYYYRRDEKIVDERISRPIFNDSAQIYAAPELVRAGTYALSHSGITINPGSESYHPAQGAKIRIEDGEVRAIKSNQREELPAYALEPRLITGLFDIKSRSKRPQIALDQIRDAVKQKVPVGVVVADAAYGVDGRFRSALQNLRFSKLSKVKDASSGPVNVRFARRPTTIRNSI